MSSEDKLAFYKEAWAELSRCGQSNRNEALSNYINIANPDVRDLIQDYPKHMDAEAFERLAKTIRDWDRESGYTAAPGDVFYAPHLLRKELDADRLVKFDALRTNADQQFVTRLNQIHGASKVLLADFIIEHEKPQATEEQKNAIFQQSLERSAKQTKSFWRYLFLGKN